MHIVDLIVAFGHIGVIGVIFAESGILLGAFLPGDSLLVTAGLLAAQGYLNIYVLIIGCVIAAILGDQVGYWTGKYFGPKIFNREDSFFFKKTYVDSTTAFFKKYGKTAIIIARFTPIVRTITPIMAGVGGMYYRTFITYNIIGGLLWAGGLLSASFIIGTYVPGVEAYLEYIIISIVLLSILPIVKEVIKKKYESRKN